jgi:hypothetical protein
MGKMKILSLLETIDCVWIAIHVSLQDLVNKFPFDDLISKLFLTSNTE